VASGSQSRRIIPVFLASRRPARVAGIELHDSCSAAVEPGTCHTRSICLCPRCSLIFAPASGCSSSIRPCRSSPS
jgi:hypothetical protein